MFSGLLEFCRRWLSYWRIRANGDGIAMVGQRQMELQVISYVPSATNSKHLDVGIIVVEKAKDQITFLDTRFVSDMNKVLAFDPHADIEMLQSCFREFEKRLHDPGERYAFLSMMQDTFSNVFQFSAPKAVLISTKPEDEIEKLASLYFSLSDN
jgi:hypothetical protein